MIKDKLRYDSKKESFYFKTEKVNIYVSTENFNDIGNKIINYNNKGCEFYICVSASEKINIVRVNDSYIDNYIRIDLIDKEISHTENIDDFLEFCENPTIELYKALDF